MAAKINEQQNSGLEDIKRFSEYLKKMSIYCQPNQLNKWKERYPMRVYSDGKANQTSTQLLKEMITAIVKADRSWMLELMKSEYSIMQSLEHLLDYLFKILKAVNVAYNKQHNTYGKEKNSISKLWPFRKLKGEPPIVESLNHQQPSNHVCVDVLDNTLKRIGGLLDSQTALLDGTLKDMNKAYKSSESISNLPSNHSTILHNDLHLIVLLLQAIISDEVSNFENMEQR